MKILQVNNTDFQGTIYNGHDLQLSLNEAGIDACSLVLHRRTECETAKSYVSDRELLWQYQYNEFESKSGLLNLLEPFGGKIKYMEEYRQFHIFNKEEYLTAAQTYEDAGRIVELYELFEQELDNTKQLANDYFQLTILKLLHCIATSNKGWTDEQIEYIQYMRTILFNKED